MSVCTLRTSQFNIREVSATSLRKLVRLLVQDEGFNFEAEPYKYEQVCLAKIVHWNEMSSTHKRPLHKTLAVKRNNCFLLLAPPVASTA